MEQNWEASLTAHLGKLVGETSYLYALGGVSWTRLRGRFTGSHVDGSGFDEWQSDTVAGWTVGAGWEMKLSTDWHLRLEYRHSQYNDARFSHSGNLDSYNSTMDSEIDYKSDTVMLGVSYRF